MLANQIQAVRAFAEQLGEPQICQSVDSLIQNIQRTKEIDAGIQSFVDLDERLLTSRSSHNPPSTTGTTSEAISGQ